MRDKLTVFCEVAADEKDLWVFGEHANGDAVEYLAAFFQQFAVTVEISLESRVVLLQQLGSHEVNIREDDKLQWLDGRSTCGWQWLHE